MSAAFGLSFNDVLKHDIRHIHSGRQPSDNVFRRPVYHPGITAQDRIFEQQTRYRYKVGHRPHRNLVYLSQYDICIPKAPAFDVFKRREIDDLVHRLNDPVPHRKRFKLTDSDMGMLGSKPGSKVSSASSYRSRALQKGEKAMKQHEVKKVVNIKELVDRLYRQGQTRSSTIRAREPIQGSDKISLRSIP